MEIGKAFGERVREMRAKRGLTQQQLGEAAGVNYKYLGSIERGTENPTLAVIAKLAGALKVRPAELLDLGHVETDPRVLRDCIATELADADVGELQAALRMLSALRR